MSGHGEGSIVLSMTLYRNARGTVKVTVAERGAVLDTGTLPDECRIVKLLVAGAMAKNGFVCASKLMIEILSSL